MKNTAAAIEFGTSKIVTLVGEGNGITPAQLLGFGVESYDGYSEGHWNASDEEVDEAIMRSVNGAANSSGKEIKEIYVGVPGEFIKIESNEVSLSLDQERRITGEDVDELMNRALNYTAQNGWVVIHRSPAWFMVDERRTMEPVGMRGTDMRCMASFVTADPVFLEDMQARFEAQSIRIAGYLSPSLGQALMLIPPEERDKTAVLIDVGYLSTEVMFVEGDALIAQSIVPVGGGHISADLAFGLSVTMEMAEEIKRQYTFGVGQSTIVIKDPKGYEVSIPREQATAIIEPRASELCEMIQSAIEGSEVKLNPRSTIYLTGGGLVLTRGGREFISSVLERPVKASQPMTSKLNSPVYSAGLGLLELVYESVSQMDGKPAAPENEKGSKVGKMFKSFFTK